jgi:hypothetical protein
MPPQSSGGPFFFATNVARIGDARLTSADTSHGEAMLPAPADGRVLRRMSGRARSASPARSRTPPDSWEDTDGFSLDLALEQDEPP